MADSPVQTVFARKQSGMSASPATAVLSADLAMVLYASSSGASAVTVDLIKPVDLGFAAAGSASVSADVHVNRGFAVTAAGTATAVVSVQVAQPPQNPPTFELKAFDSSGNVLGWLPDYVKVSMTDDFANGSGLNLTYARTGVNYGLLTGAEPEVGVFLNGTELKNGRFIIQQSSAEMADPSKTDETFQGLGYVQSLKQIAIYPYSWPSTSQAKWVFLSAAPGDIINSMLQAAINRGVAIASKIGQSTWNASRDSKGVLWSQTVTISYEPGTGSLYKVLTDLAANGALEFEMVGRELYLYNPGTLGTDRSAQARPVVLELGRDLLDAPVNKDSTTLATVVLVQGDKNQFVEVSDSTAIGQIGRREMYVSQSGVTDTATLQLIGQANLDLVKQQKVEYTHGLRLNGTWPDAFADYQVGDYVFRNVTGSNERYRIQQLVLQAAQDGTMSASVTLNDKFTELDIQLTRRLSALTSAAVAPTPPPDTPDQSTPNPPSGLQVTTSAYTDDLGNTRAQVTVSWSAPTTNGDGSNLTDLAGYDLYVRDDSDTAPWRYVGQTGQTSLNQSDLPPNTWFRWAADAFDSSGNKSGLSTEVRALTGVDTTAPAQPTTPTVSSYLGQLKIVWDGMAVGNTVMPPDFATLQVHVSTVNGFTPSAATLVDQIDFAAAAITYFTGTYGTTYYVAFVAVDTSGNASIPSAQASGVPVKASDGDIASLSVGKLTAGSLVADMTLAARIKTADTGARVEMNSTGIQVYNSSGTQVINLPSNGGTATFQGNISASTISGSTIIGGTIETASSGSRVVLSNTNYNQVTMYSANGGESQPASLFLDSGATYNSLDVKGAQYGGNSIPGLYLASDTTGGAGANANLDAPAYVLITAQGSTSSYVQLSGGVAQFTFKTADVATNQNPFIQGGGNCAAKFAVRSGTPEIQSRGANDAAYGQFTGSNFLNTSARQFKTDIEQWDESALDLVKSAKVYRYKKLTGVDDDGAKRWSDRPQYGPILDEMPQHVVVDDEVYDMGSTIGLLWKAIQELDAKIEQKG